MYKSYFKESYNIPNLETTNEYLEYIRKESKKYKENNYSSLIDFLEELSNFLESEKEEIYEEIKDFGELPSLFSDANIEWALNDDWTEDDSRVKELSLNISREYSRKVDLSLQELNDIIIYYAEKNKLSHYIGILDDDFYFFTKEKFLKEVELNVRNLVKQELSKKNKWSKWLKDVSRKIKSILDSYGSKVEYDNYAFKDIAKGMHEGSFYIKVNVIDDISELPYKDFTIRLANHPSKKWRADSDKESGKNVYTIMPDWFDLDEWISEQSGDDIHSYMEWKAGMKATEEIDIADIKDLIEK